MKITHKSRDILGKPDMIFDVGIIIIGSSLFFYGDIAQGFKLFCYP
jgi:hypothetical protein